MFFWLKHTIKLKHGDKHVADPLEEGTCKVFPEAWLLEFLSWTSEFCPCWVCRPAVSFKCPFSTRLQNCYAFYLFCFGGVYLKLCLFAGKKIKVGLVT